MDVNEAYMTVMNSGQTWAMERAQYAVQVHNAVQQGQLSPSEAKEILLDLINTQKLDEASSDMQLRAALVFGITQVISLYG
jgi:polyhydroxyalkanoate synthesis regulator phasin